MVYVRHSGRHISLLPDETVTFAYHPNEIGTSRTSFGICFSPSTRFAGSNPPQSCRLARALPCRSAMSAGYSVLVVIFIESFSRATELSLTGRLVYPIAHRFFVQWPDLATSGGERNTRVPCFDLRHPRHARATFRAVCSNSCSRSRRTKGSSSNTGHTPAREGVRGIEWISSRVEKSVPSARRASRRCLRTQESARSSPPLEVGKLPPRGVGFLDSSRWASTWTITSLRLRPCSKRGVLSVSASSVTPLRPPSPLFGKLARFQRDGGSSGRAD